MNRKEIIWASVVVVAIMVGSVAGASIVSAPTEAVWFGKVDQPDPRDLNRAEAIAHNARWAASVKAEKERVAAEAKRKADEEEARKATEVARQQTKPAPVSPRPTNPYTPNQGTVAPLGDPWMDTYNRLSSSLPGNWSIGDKGSWGATAPDNGNVWIARRTPLYALVGVMLHESCHVRQGRVFGSYAAARVAMEPYGGMERTADACARNMDAGAWIGYGVDAKAFQGARLF